LTGAAKLVRQDDGSWQARFLPAWITDDGSPQMLEPHDPRFAQVVMLLAESSQQAGLRTQFTVDGGELLLSPEL
jgi:hypothetical protein